MSVIRDLLDSTKLLLNDSLATTGSNTFIGTQLITGSIVTTGTVDGVDVSILKSSFDTIEGKTLVSGSSQITIGDINGYTPFSSSIETSISTQNDKLNSIESFTASIDTAIKAKLDSDGIISGSSQVSFTEIDNKPNLISGSIQSINNTAIALAIALG